MRGLLFSLLCQQALKRQGRPSGLIGQYKPYLNSNDSPTRDILKDYSGQGHDIQLYNFGYEGMSGYNPVPGSFVKVGIYSFNADLILNSTHLLKFNVISDLKYKSQIGTIPFSSSGLPKGSYTFNNKSNYDIIIGDYNLVTVSYTIKSGISKIEVEEYTGAGSYYFIYSGGDIPAGTIIEIEQLSDYPGALVSDGVDDYGICENFPILTKEKGYTIVAIRKILSEADVRRVFISNCLDLSGTQNLGAFYFERIEPELKQCFNFGRVTTVEINKELCFTYQTANSYNGTYLNIGDNLGQPYLRLFSWYNTNSAISIALYALEIYDHDLTDEEIESVKEAMVREYEKETGNVLEGV